MIPAGASHRWFNCGASAAEDALELVIEPSDLARECQAAEWLLRQACGHSIPHAQLLEPRTAPNGWKITLDMARHVDDLFRVINDSSTEIDVIEGATAMQNVGGVNGIRGVLSQKDGKLRAWTIDYGWKLREVNERHDLAMLLMLGASMNRCRIDEFGLTVYQPRPYHHLGPLRTGWISNEYLGNWSRLLSDAVAVAHNPKAPAVAGRQCVGCSHVGRCNNAEANLYAHRDLMRGERLGFQADGPTLALQIEHADEIVALAEARRDALKLEAEARMLQGEWIPNYVMRSELGDRELVNPVAAGFALGVDAFEEPKPKTPAKLEREGVDRKELAKFTRRVPLPPKLKRIKPGDIERSFKK